LVLLPPCRERLRTLFSRGRLDSLLFRSGEADFRLHLLPLLRRKSFYELIEVERKGLLKRQRQGLEIAGPEEEEREVAGGDIVSTAPGS
jgi:hypothetical protein